jgi:microcystin-dependent protein
MSVLGQKVTKLSQINYIQPGDTFLAIRGGVSYKVFGDRIASVEQLNAAKAEYTLRLNNAEQTLQSSLVTFNTKLNAISSIAIDDMFLKTDGVYLSATVLSLSSYAYREIALLKAGSSQNTYVDAVSSNIVNWSTSTFLTKLSAQKTYIPLPAANIYSDADGSTLTWNKGLSAWTAGPGVSIFAKQDVGPVGSIILYGGNTAPEGYLECNGQAVSKTTYATLWNTIGDTYGRPPGLSNELFKVPNLADMGIIASESSLGPVSVSAMFCIKALVSETATANTILSSYLKISTQSSPVNDQYLRFSNGEWIPSTPTLTVSPLPTASVAGSLLTWTGSTWVAGSPQIQSVYTHNSITASISSTECVFTDIPSTAKKITVVVSNLNITDNNGTFVKLRLGNNSGFVISGYNDSCQGIYANTFQRASGGYYSYITNASNPSDGAYLLVKIDDYVTGAITGGLDTIITFMRAGTNLNSSSTWVYTHTGRIGRSVIHGAGSVLINSLSAGRVGFYPPNPNSFITSGQMTLYWE